jgi:hypothetical protein
MSRPDLSPEAVAERLEWLRTHFVSDGDRGTRARLEDPERLRPTGTFAQAVAHRLVELRALCELTEHLHRARPRPDPR